MTDRLAPTERSRSGEFGLIDWIRARTATGDATVIGIGDDCAVLRVTPGADLVVTTDMLMDGRHFHLERDGARAAGYKAMAVNLSDIAAMAARPVAAVVSVALPKADAVSVARELHEGLTAAAAPFGVSLVGGDTNAWDGPLVVSVTLLGETTPRGVITRGGAKPGDVVFVTGPLGGSLLGRHLAPEPRVVEALALHEAAPLHALIDLSDGLSSDLNHILEESAGLGAILEAAAIPIHADAIAASAQDGRTPLAHALNDGEDFELVVVVDPADAERLAASSPATLIRIGAIVAEPGLRLRDEHGRLSGFEPGGFDHLGA